MSECECECECVCMCVWRGREKSIDLSLKHRVMYVKIGIVGTFTKPCHIVSYCFHTVTG